MTKESATPFRDTAAKIAGDKGYLAMSVGSDGARSHTWWKRLVEYGPWQTRGYGRLGPPDPDALDGIAKLFGTTAEQVAVMVAADWYSVHPTADVSTRVRRLSPLLDRLNEADAELVGALVRRLASDV
jgi:hypothetical protein